MGTNPDRLVRARTGAPGAAYAAVDGALFDVEAVPFTTGDIRTVGEMLADVDQQARSLLLDVDGDDGEGLVRGWPALVAAASEFWMTLPRIGHADATLDRPMERLRAHAAAFDSHLTAGWPGRETPDRRLTHMTDTLRAAASLVRTAPKYPAAAPRCVEICKPPGAGPCKRCT